jgi:hypothetical protein
MPERRRQALAMMSAVDDGVGQIMGSLRRHDLEENTLVFFIGDNGAPLKIHKLDAPGGGPGWDGSLNEPLNGEKGMLSEGGIRVPFVAFWKGQFEGGQLYHHPVISLDVAATAVALAGLPADPELDGVNLVPFLRGEADHAPHETLYWRWIAQAAVREGNWKYLVGGQRNYLFDLNADREEKHNLLAKHPEIAKQLQAKLKGWSAELSPPGLATKKMSETWERYYDHYLDGKLAEKPTTDPNSTRRADRGAVNGWLSRNGTAQIRDGVLQVRPAKSSRSPPFIVMNGLNLPKNVTVVVKLRSEQEDKASFEWRQDGQKEFPGGQVVRFDCGETADLTDHRIAINGTGKLIHIRFRLPATGADVASIEFQNADGKTLRSWSFNK